MFVLQRTPALRSPHRSRAPLRTRAGSPPELRVRRVQRTPLPVGEPKLAVLPTLDPQPPIVHQTVAARAQRDEVRQRRRSATATPLHVVHHQAPRARRRPAAVAIAPGHRLAQAPRDHGVARRRLTRCRPPTPARCPRRARSSNQAQSPSRARPVNTAPPVLLPRSLAHARLVTPTPRSPRSRSSGPPLHSSRAVGRHTCPKACHPDHCLLQ